MSKELRNVKLAFRTPFWLTIFGGLVTTLPGLGRSGQLGFCALTLPAVRPNARTANKDGWIAFILDSLGYGAAGYTAMESRYAKACGSDTGEFADSASVQVVLFEVNSSMPIKIVPPDMNSGT